MIKALLASSALLGALVAPSPAPAPQAPPSPGPSTAPAPTVTATPLPSASPTPAVTPALLPTPLVLPPDAPPQILAVQLSDPVFHGGETVTGTVITSTNVSQVEIHLGRRTVHVPRFDLGVWQMTYRMPHVPFFMRGNYTAQIVAMNQAGATAVREISVSIR